MLLFGGFSGSDLVSCWSGLDGMPAGTRWELADGQKRDAEGCMFGSRIIIYG